ncbi:phosphoglycerate mutase [Oceanisphaera profunda]|uniref:Phosphoglycerate mutase n=1 Tax=Oceanisphaera profunda TaxID=1416627 RepID=A0A1Y0D243_9GAMM|nr:histidine phosphatase family protein [Oceanisphaera profunda]ART81602.1 phosphoglycerate mutase [Oceanisphaera profunda]
MELYIWRHPKPLQAAGVCLGHTDMGVDQRKLRRLANHIQRFTRRHGLPKVIWVSPLQRSLDVGRILAKRGFRCEVAPALAELNFGDWDGKPWQHIAKQDIDAWCDNFSAYAPGGGENLQQLFARVASWITQQDNASPSTHVLAVGHAGWINAAIQLANKRGLPKSAADWPRPVAYRQLSQLTISTAQL